RQTTLAGAGWTGARTDRGPVYSGRAARLDGYAAGIQQLRPEQAVRAPDQLAAGGILAAFAGIRVAGRYHACRAYPDGLRGRPDTARTGRARRCMPGTEPPAAARGVLPSARAPRRNVSGIGITCGPARRRSRWLRPVRVHS